MYSLHVVGLNLMMHKYTFLFNGPVSFMNKIKKVPYLIPRYGVAVGLGFGLPSRSMDSCV